MLFAKRKTPSVVDLVWLTKKAKLDGVLEAVRDGQSDHGVGLILAHFSQTISELEAVLKTQGIQYRFLDRPSDVHRHASSKGDWNRDVVLMALSERLGTPSGLSFDSSREPAVRIVVAERYPTEDRDQAVLSFAQSCGVSGAVPFHTSLEDPLLMMFGSGGLGDLLRRIGVDETSPISQEEVAAAIRSAQRRIQKQATGDHRVRSAEEWFRYNMRQ